VEWVEWVEWAAWECKYKNPKQNSKRAVFTALFFYLYENSSMKSENKNNYLNKKYEIVVTIKTITAQIERLARSCFSLEFDCRKLGSTNINTPIR
jgi:predicted DsbA family dithiol-disulfide isomerase